MRQELIGCLQKLRRTRKLTVVLASSLADTAAYAIWFRVKLGVPMTADLQDRNERLFHLEERLRLAGVIVTIYQNGKVVSS